MDAYRSLVRSSGAAAIGRVMEDFAQEAGPTTFSDGQKISLAGVVTASKTKMTKKNTLMAYVTLEDGTGAIEMLCFTRALNSTAAICRRGRSFTSRVRSLYAMKRHRSSCVTLPVR